MKDKYSVPALYRADAVLKAIAEEPNRWRMSDLSKKLGISKSTLHSLLVTMEKLQWIRKDRDETYALGNGMGYFGSAYLDRFDLAEEFRIEAEPVMQKLQETVQLARLDGRHVVYIARVQSNSPVQMVSGPGARFPAHATGLGKILLSGLDEDELLRLFPDPELPKTTVHTIGSRDVLLRELKKVREAGYALDEQEGVMGFCCIAAPVKNRGKIVAAVSCSIPVHNWGGKKDEAVREIRRLAERLSTRI